MSEKVTALCSMCGKETQTTWEAMQENHKCPKCGHGDLSIIFGEYTEIANLIYKAADYLRKVESQADRRRLAKPITDQLGAKGVNHG